VIGLALSARLSNIVNPPYVVARGFEMVTAWSKRFLCKMVSSLAQLALEAW